MGTILETLNLLSESWIEVIWRLTWQGAILIGIIFLITRVFRNIPANIKHLLWFLVIIKFLIAPLVNPVGIPLLKSSPSVTGNVKIQDLPAIDKDVPIPPLSFDEESISSHKRNVIGIVPAKEAWMSLTKESFIFLAWLIGALFFMANVFYRSIKLKQILKHGKEIKDGIIVELVKKDAKCFRLKRLPMILSASRFATPLSCGIIKPVILLPEEITGKLSQQELKFLLYHELAHIKRWDILTNWLQLIMQVIHFYNPLIWYVNSKIRLEREIACDDLVLFTAVEENKEYADTLIKIVELTNAKDRGFSLGIVGISEPFSNMRVRLVEILRAGRKLSTRISIESVICMLFLGILTIPLYSAVQKKTEVVSRNEEISVAEKVGEKKLDEVSVLSTKPVLRESSGQPAPQELVARILKANEFWLHPPVKKLSYTFSMKHTGADDLWEANVTFTGPDHLTIIPLKGEKFEGKVEDDYDPSNSARPPFMTTILQGVGFFGPLHAFRTASKDYALSIVDEATIRGNGVYILHLIPIVGPPPAVVEHWEEILRDLATRPMYMYEFLPVEKEIDGVKQTVIEIKTRYNEGPSWLYIKTEHNTNPTQIKWGGYIITADIRNYRGQERAVIVFDRDPDFQGESPIKGTTFEDGIGNMTLKLILGEGEEIFDKEIYNKEKARRPKPERWLPMRTGCGVWKTFYGYAGHGAKIDQIWLDKKTGVVLKEEGFTDGECRFTVEYGDFEEIVDGRQVPCHIMVTLHGQNDEHFNLYPWVFDMKFTTLNGTAWLLKHLEEFQNNRFVTTADISDAKVEVFPYYAVIKDEIPQQKKKAVSESTKHESEYDATGEVPFTDVVIEDKEYSDEIIFTKKRAECALNMRELGVPLALYATEHDGHFPPNLKDIEPYLHSRVEPFRLFCCPLTDTQIHSWNEVDTKGDYTYNPGLILSHGPTQRPEDILLIEREFNHRGESQLWKNYLFRDGHVESHTEVSQKKGASVKEENRGFLVKEQNQVIEEDSSISPATNGQDRQSDSSGDVTVDYIIDGIQRHQVLIRTAQCDYKVEGYSPKEPTNKRWDTGNWVWKRTESDMWGLGGKELEKGAGY